MEFSELIKVRHSVRAFSDKPVKRELLEKILEAGRLAPTAKNLQPIKIIAAESKSLREKLAQVSPCTFGAPVVLIFCGDRSECYLREDGCAFDEIDSCIVATHVMLAAANEGLGTTWVGRFLTKDLSEALALPENIVPYAMMPLGYPAEGETPSPRHSERKALADIVEYR